MKIKYLYPVMLLPALLFGVPDNNKKGVESIKKGFDFYDGTKDNNEERLNKNYLKLIYDESKKQTKIQSDILKLLKKKLDPQPKMITKEDGTKCVANSSIDCFDYASLIENHPEVNKIPALKEALSNPEDLAKVAKYIEWQQGGLFKHAFNVGNAMQMAQEQWGDKINPLGLYRSTHNNSTGISNAILVPDAKKRYLNTLKDKITYNLFLGFDKNLDILSTSSIASILMEYPELKFNIYYSNNEIKVLFEDLMKTLYSNNIKNYNLTKKEINPKIFKTFEIYTTPSLVVVYKNKEELKAQTIATGRFNEKDFVTRVYNFLELNKLIDYKKFSDTKIWNSESGKKHVQEFYKNKFGVEVLKDEK